jgi:hypothetical protein
MHAVTRSLLAAAAIGLVGTLPAQAAIVQVGSVAGLTQGPYSLEDFEDLTYVPGVTFSAPSGPVSADAFSFANSVTPSGAFGLSTVIASEPITITFAAPASSVGLYFGNDDSCCSGGFSAALDIYGMSGLIGTLFVVANMNDDADQFIGFTSDEQVTSVTLRYGAPPYEDLFVYIDDLRFNVADPGTAVPEPMTMTLFGAGLFGLAGAWRLRRRPRTA